MGGPELDQPEGSPDRGRVAEPGRMRAGDRTPGLELSVVVPVLNEREAMPELLAELEHVLQTEGFTYELIFIDDGSTDGTGAYLDQLALEHPEIEVIMFARNFGKSAALDAGFGRSRGAIVVTIDGDGQDDPAEIPALIERLADGYEMVSGWKRARRDPVQRRLASRLFNAEAVAQTPRFRPPALRRSRHGSELH